MTVAMRTTTVVPITSLRLGPVTFFISELVSRKKLRVLVHPPPGRATLGFSDDIASIRILDLQQKTIRRAIHSLIATYFRFGRPRGTRTPNLRFWRPLLCQLSYWPTVAQKTANTDLCADIPLLRFPMNRVLTVVTAELLQFELLRHGLFVLRRRVVPTLALGALQRDDFSSLACHLCFFLNSGALDEI